MRTTEMKMKTTKMPMTVENMRAHARDLALAFDIQLVFDASLTPHGAGTGEFEGIQFVMSYPIVDETMYAVVLHELGHRLHPSGHVRADMKLAAPAPGCHSRDRHRWMSLKLVEEEAAWDWAQHHALWWTPAMDNVRQWAFGTYEDVRRRTR